MEHPPFELVTPEYWAKRSDSPAYQRAYSLLAQQIPFNYNGIVADIACGTGRLLAKLHAQMPKGVLVGTDISDKMLEVSKSYLERKNIPVYMESNPSSLNLSQPGVHLVKDDIVNSQLPDSFSRRTFFTFPELGEGHPSQQDDMELINLAVRDLKIDLMRFPDIQGLLVDSHVQKNLSRITKSRGRITMTNYIGSRVDEPERDIQIKEQLKLRLSWFNLRLHTHQFYPDKNIWSDTLGVKMGKEIPKETRQGYWLSIAEKL